MVFGTLEKRGEKDSLSVTLGGHLSTRAHAHAKLLLVEAGLGDLDTWNEIWKAWASHRIASRCVACRISNIDYY